MNMTIKDLERECRYEQLMLFDEDRSNRHLSDLYRAVVNHDIRNPLSTVLLYCKLMEGKFDTEMERDLSYIRIRANLINKELKSHPDIGQNQIIQTYMKELLDRASQMYYKSDRTDPENRRGLELMYNTVQEVGILVSEDPMSARGIIDTLQFSRGRDDGKGLQLSVEGNADVLLERRDRIALYNMLKNCYDHGEGEIRFTVEHEDDRVIFLIGNSVKEDDMSGTQQGQKIVKTIASDLGREYSTRTNINVAGNGKRYFVVKYAIPRKIDDTHMESGLPREELDQYKYELLREN